MEQFNKGIAEFGIINILISVDIHTHFTVVLKLEVSLYIKNIFYSHKVQVPPSPPSSMRENVVAFCAQKAKMLTFCSDEQVSEILGLPEHVRPIGIIALGYSDEKPARLERISSNR
ncbi:MAG: hypothetical protein M3247_08655, partial [Thermoproteota archaeon]|nr:hypothetical protein [Thermoproteota archaeon]